jgi:hypothetical protein
MSWEGAGRPTLRSAPNCHRNPVRNSVILYGALAPNSWGRALTAQCPASAYHRVSDESGIEESSARKARSVAYDRCKALRLCALRAPFSLAGGERPMGVSGLSKTIAANFFPRRTAPPGSSRTLRSKKVCPLRSSTHAAAQVGSGARLPPMNGPPSQGRMVSREHKWRQQCLQSVMSRSRKTATSRASSRRFVPRSHRHPAQSEQERRHAAGLSRL